MSRMRWDRTNWSDFRIDPTLGVVPEGHFVSFGKRVNIHAKPTPESKRWGTDQVKRDPEKFRAAHEAHMANPEFHKPKKHTKRKSRAAKGS
jgi:hypothetical protein